MITANFTITIRGHSIPDVTAEEAAELHAELARMLAIKTPRSNRIGRPVGRRKISIADLIEESLLSYGPLTRADLVKAVMELAESKDAGFSVASVQSLLSVPDRWRNWTSENGTFFHREQDS